MDPARGVLLYSGGLDSLLAGRILLNQSIELIGLYCILPFFAHDMDPSELYAVTLANQINLKLRYYRCDLDYIATLKDPPHGYGKNLNPCIDCKIHFLKKAAELMREIGGDFVASGEVVGQRPMSQQKHMLIHIEKESGLKGRLLRPLSAKLLAPTIPEVEGKINRDALYGISGRGRGKQIQLAKEFGITEYNSPAGGCLFTDPFYSKKAADLFAHFQNVLPIHMYLLTIGRHFRLKKTLKVIIARNEIENSILIKQKSFADAMMMPEFKGPSAYLMGDILDNDIIMVASIISRYGDPKSDDNRIAIIWKDESIDYISAVNPIETVDLEQYRI